MAILLLLQEFVARQDDLRCVDDHDVIAGVQVRSKVRLVFASQTLSDLGRETSKDDPVGIDEPPLARYLTRFGGVGLQSPTLVARKNSSPLREKRRITALSWGVNRPGWAGPARFVLDRHEAEAVWSSHRTRRGSVLDLEDRRHLVGSPLALAHLEQCPHQRPHHLLDERVSPGADP